MKNTAPKSCRKRRAKQIEVVIDYTPYFEYINATLESIDTKLDDTNIKLDDVCRALEPSEGATLEIIDGDIKSSGATLDDINVMLIVLLIFLGIIEGTLLFRHFRK